ncbi:hypothetical protein JCM12298_26460 [Desulfothermus naphthae]
MSEKSQKTPKQITDKLGGPPKPSRDKEIIEKDLPPVDYTPPTPPVKPPKKDKKD